MNEAKILKKIGNLLSKYGVSDEEKEKFLLDLKDKELDDQEEIEEIVEEEEVEEANPTETEEKTPNEEEKQPQEEAQEEEQGQENEELKKALDGALARIQALEDIVAKMGVPLENGEVGLVPNNPSGANQVESEFDRINRMRMGRK